MLLDSCLSSSRCSISCKLAVFGFGAWIWWGNNFAGSSDMMPGFSIRTGAPKARFVKAKHMDFLGVPRKHSSHFFLIIVLSVSSFLPSSGPSSVFNAMLRSVWECSGVAYSSLFLPFAVHISGCKILWVANWTSAPAWRQNATEGKTQLRWEMGKKVVWNLFPICLLKGVGEIEPKPWPSLTRQLIEKWDLVG